MLSVVMRPIEPDSVLDALNWRYATKTFDSNRKIPDDTWSALEDSLVLTPSSFGLQPWKFLVVTDPSIREQLLPHAWGQRQVVDASHLLIMAVPRQVDPATIDRLIEDTARSRGTDPTSLEGYKKMIVGFVLQGMTVEQQKDWAVRQVYIALGQFMMAAALMGIDTCPMEGFIPADFDKVLGFEEKGLTTGVLCPAGYRADDDKYAAFPKVRYPKAELVEHL